MDRSRTLLAREGMPSRPYTGGHVAGKNCRWAGMRSCSITGHRRTRRAGFQVTLAVGMRSLEAWAGVALDRRWPGGEMTKGS